MRSDDDFWLLLSERDIVREPVARRYGKGVQPVGGSSGGSRLASSFEGLIRDDDEWLFDRSLFGVSQNEMLRLEPQVRMLLTCAWEALEHVGWDLQSLRNSPTGVFVGAQIPAVGNWRPMYGADEYTVAGTSLAMLANRVSYHFNLTGSSMAYCTACSAGISALHSAVNALQCGDCEQALVGSVNYLGSAGVSSGFNALGIISADGKCRSFDADANGYMRSEGAFVFAVKPLAAAERDGDAIHAVVEATAVNTAGSADGADGLAPGRMITAPTRHAQIDLMREACSRAKLAPGDFDYVEAHATGTAVGDPVEGNAIAEAYGGAKRRVPLRVSSVKSNVGHMEAAAFHCSLLKVVLMMQRRTFAPISRNYLAPNPEIDFESCPMEVQTACEPFPEHPVTVGINSFGFGGANGHCVVREYRPKRPPAYSVPLAPEAGFMIPLSARNAAGLSRGAEQLRDTLRELNIDLYTLAGNLGRRRTHFAARASFVAWSRVELIEALDAFAQNPEPVAMAEGGGKRVAMVFAGQGTQWAGCGRTLYEADPVFRRTVDAIEGYWRERSDVSLREACFSAPQKELNEVRLAQPSIFMIQCALVELFKTWGVYPDCVVGHSSGEVAAAYACGALSLKEATRLVFHRAALQQRTAGSGRMLAIGLDRSGVERMLGGLGIRFRPDGGQPVPVEVACENAPASTVVCGKEAALRPVIEELDRRNLQNRLLPGNIAFHSAAMNPIEEDMRASLSFLDDRSFVSDAPFVSSVTGMHTRQLDSSYWWSNVRQPVRFATAMETVQRDYRPDAILEIAPHCALQTVIAQCIEGNAAAEACIPTLMKGADTCLGFQKALGALFRAGVELDFAAHYPRPEPVAHLLPGHPKDEHKTNDETQDDEFFQQRTQYSHGPMVGRRLPSEHLFFEARLSMRDLPWLGDHRVHHASIIPAAGYIELVLQALKGVPVHIEVLEFLQPCPIPEQPVRLQTVLHPVAASPDEFTFSISSQPYEADSESELHCRGKVRRLIDDHVPAVPGNLADIDKSGFEPVIPPGQGDEFYERVQVVLDRAFEYGPVFRTIQTVDMDRSRDSMSYHADIAMDHELWTKAQQEGCVVCPPLLDGGLQLFLLNLMCASDLFVMPLRAEDVTFLRAPTSPRVTAHVNEPPESWFDITQHGQFSVRHGERIGGSISLYDSVTGELIAYIGKYFFFANNPKWNDLPQSRHVISWQPKFVPDSKRLVDRLPDGDVQPAALIATLTRSKPNQYYAGHVIEFAGSREADQTALKQCVDCLASVNVQAEFWLVSDNDESARANYGTFHQHDAALRFESLDEGWRSGLDKGLLRPAVAEVIFLHREAAAFQPKDWDSIQRVAVAGGLVLVCHDEGDDIRPSPAWTVVRAGRRTTLLQAPQSWGDTLEIPEILGPRWVLGEVDSLAANWASLLDSPDVHVIPDETFASGEIHLLDEWPQAAALRAVDFFFGSDPQDPTGELAVSRLVAFIQALVAHRMDGNSPCRVTVTTTSAAFEVDNPRGSALWGAVRSIAIEVGIEANLDFRLVDLGAPDDLEALLLLARCDVRECELAVRGNRLWAPRMVGIRERYACVAAEEVPAYRLTLDNPGQITGLEMKTYELPALRPEDVEINVSAAALNFRDVMVTLGLLPELAYERSALGHEVGMEASGVVRRVGSGVRDRCVGEEVAFIGGGCIANRVVADERLVFAKPAHLSMEEAASVLSVYVTAYYSLIHLARLRKGQRVLIHSAMGGVGQAAVALAKHVGAEIYATAGSESKRRQLQALGVRAAFDSHSFGWRAGLMEATSGEGVDVVLNSLAGRHIELCLQALRPGGWHCEIGKVDIYADHDLKLRIFRKNLRFAAIDIDRLMIDDKSLSRELSQACLDLLDRGVVPPVPVTVFPYSDYASALRLMTTGRHQGKLVLRAPCHVADRDFAIADSRPLFDPAATYLVTGGLGGFGLRLLPYLVSSGVRHLTLMDRDPLRRRDADWVRRSSTLAFMNEDVELDIVPGDVAVEEDVQRCVAQIQRPLKGVFHLAGVLDDCLLDDLTPASLAKVFAPKALGALHLHRATAACKLDHFVLFSSITSALGNPGGQVNYGAANGYLDGLAVSRRRRGLPCLSYNLAAVADAGMASGNLALLRMLRTAGLPPVSSDFAVANLDYAMRSMSGWDHLVTVMFERPSRESDSRDYMRIGRLMRNQDAFDTGESGELTLETVVAQIATKVAELCGHDEGDPNEPLSSFGLTSISVTELGAFILAEFNYQVSALELMTTASCTSLANGIVYGKSDTEEVGAEPGSGGLEHAVQVSEQGVRRAPSAFASALEDHFPREADFKLADLRVR